MKDRFPLLAAAVLTPVVVLAGFAWRGVETQRRAIWADRREDAARLATAWAEQGRFLMDGSVIDVSIEHPLNEYPDPPIPIGDASGSQALEAAKNNELALSILRDARTEPGLSEAGLPVNVLAGARLLEMYDTPDNRGRLGYEAVHSPSVLTPVIVDNLRKRGDSTWEAQWQAQEPARQLVRRHPDVEAGWVLDNGAVWWIDRPRPVLPGTGRVLSLAEMNDSLWQHIPLPPWAHLRLMVKGLSSPVDEPLAEQAVGDRYGPLMAQVTGDGRDIEAIVRSQGTWTFSMVGMAFMTAVAGLYFIRRTLTRERRLNELKSHFVASVSHELRAPVGSIRLMADALDEGKVSPETAADFHRLISREGKRLSNLIENVLDFARIEQGRRRWHFEAADLSSLVTDTMKLMEPLAAEKGINLIRTPADYEAEPEVDSSAIQQALVNLLDNAIKFSPPKTTIKVNLRSRGKQWTLGVKDQGPGIPASEHTKIFERFYRPGDELRRETQGTGIGLSLVKAIAEAHGGKVMLESNPGTGSKFMLVIPFEPRMDTDPHE